MVFALVVVFFSAISAMAASSVIPPGSAFAAASSGRQSAAPVGLMGDPPEVSGDPGPLADSVPPQVLADSTQVVVVTGEVPPVGGFPDSIQVVVVPGEVSPVADFQIQGKLM